jgi:hypothetical protein
MYHVDGNTTENYDDRVLNTTPEGNLSFLCENVIQRANFRTSFWALYGKNCCEQWRTNCAQKRAGVRNLNNMETIHVDLS